MPLIQIQTDQNQRELLEHGTAQFPLVCNYDYFHEFLGNHIQCHWHDDLEIPVVLHGAVRYQLKDQTVELRPGEGMVINARTPHSAVPIGTEEPVLLTTIFHPSLLYGSPVSTVYQTLMGPYMNAPELAGVRLSPEQVNTMKRIDVLCREAPFGYELEIKGLLCLLFSQLLSSRKDCLAAAHPSSEESLDRLKVLLDMIHRDYAGHLSLADLAAGISISREGCCRLFKAMTGKTIFQYLEDYRVSQGILLLQDDRYSITQVAYLVGFGNPGRFSAAFVRRMGCTPREYRRKLHSDPETV